VLLAASSIALAAGILSCSESSLRNVPAGGNARSAAAAELGIA
jgi:hypothetical protein